MNGRIDEDLIQRVLDGDATAAEETQLRDLMATTPEVRARYEELERVFVALRDVRPVEPAPEQVASVLHAVRALAPGGGGAVAEPSGWRGALDAIRARLTPSLAYAFAAGAIAGVALLGAFDQRLRRDLDGASPGALLPSTRLSSAGVVDTARLDANAFTGVVRTHAFEGALVAEIECGSGDAAALGLTYDVHGLAVLRFERSSPAAGEIVLEPGRVRLSAPHGSYRIWFEKAGSGSSDLAVQVVVGGSTLERVVRTVPEDL